MNSRDEIVRFDAIKLCHMHTRKAPPSRKQCWITPPIKKVNNCIATTPKRSVHTSFKLRIPLSINTYIKKKSNGISRITPCDLTQMDTIKTSSTLPSAANTQRDSKSSLSFANTKCKKPIASYNQTPKPLGDIDF